MFHKILIANRGEIALRILRACREMDIQVVAAPPPPQLAQAPADPPEPVNQQIIIDCYILEIAEAANTLKGNNILQNLAVTLNPGSYSVFKGSLWGNGSVPANPGSRANSSVTSDKVVATPDSGNSLSFIQTPSGTPVITTNQVPAMTLNNTGSISGRIFGAGLTWAGLTYSLNIANAVDRRVETMSRPTLMTFLQKESRFFSGTELVNVSSGNYGSNLSRYDFGIALTVLPESLVGDLLTLNIGIESSNIESPNLNLLTTLDIDKTRVETTAKVHLGETIMLGGLYKRIETQSKSGFPGLRDVPFIQYFFSQELTVSSRSSIVLLLTPRSPETVKSAVNRAMTRESVSPHYSELMARNPDWFHTEINAPKIFSYINLNPVLYYEFRTGDILPPSWGYEPALVDKLGELASFLYF